MLSGGFTYFCIAPDTNDTTYHIELRYGSDLYALGQYDKGNYAYGLAPEFPQSMTRRWLRTVLNFSAQRIFLSSKKQVPVCEYLIYNKKDFRGCPSWTAPEIL